LFFVSIINQVLKLLSGVESMKTGFLKAALVAFTLSSLVVAQTTPTVVPDQKPSLRRDRTQKVLYPKIVQYEDERTVPPDLLDILTFSHGGARKRTIMALGRIGYPSSVTALIEILNNDRTPEIRALAAFSLGEIESHYAVTPLLDRLQPTNETSVEVRARAVEALGKIGSNPLSAASLGRYGVGAVAESIAKLLPAPTEQPSEDAKFVGSLALTALLKLRQAATVPSIIAQLNSVDADLRWQAANALARIREGIAPAVPVLITKLEDKNTIVRATAARALGAARDPQAIAPLIKLLSDPEEHAVVNAINALGAVGDARAAEPLVALGNRLLAGYRTFDRAKGGVPTQQNQLLLIATALGNIKDASALPFLKSFRFADGRLGANPEIEIAVAKLGEAAFFDIPESASLPRDNWKAVAAYAQGLGQIASDRSRTILTDLLEGKTYGKPDVRAVSAILNAMSESKVTGLREILLAQLKAEDVIVRTTAATLLGDLNDTSEEVINALKDAYQAARTDKMNDARIAIIETANKLKHPMNIQALAVETRDPDYVVRKKAVELFLQSEIESTTTRLQIGKVETGHNRDYWNRITQLSLLKKNPVAILHTRKGLIRIELFASDAPMTVDNFMSLARSGFYNGLSFGRVVPNFVIQGGDPRGDMNGGPDYQIRCEINYRRYGAGSVGMALSGKDTGGSQFFITHSPQPHLDGGYTLFGQVTEGMDVVNRIARDDVIEKVEIVESK
jgi:cyclophilin family peptidyl-prolyl cis-trans isomerase